MNNAVYTTLRMLLGLVNPSAGRATIYGRAHQDLGQPLRHVGAMLEASSLHPGRSGTDHLRLQARAAGVARPRIAEIVEEVGRRAEKSGVPIFEPKSEGANLEEIFLTLIHHADSQGAER